VSSGQTTDVISEGSDDQSTIPTSSLNEESLHNAITRILPQVQPGLFPTEICDHLSAEHQDLIWEKYRNPDSFKTMIHHTLTAMLKQKKVGRQNAVTERGGRSHQYIGLGQLHLVRTNLTKGSDTKSPTLGVADSHLKVLTRTPDVEQHTHREIPSHGATSALPAAMKDSRKPHTGISIARAATSHDSETLSRPTKGNPEPVSKILHTQATNGDQPTTNVTSKTSETGVQSYHLEKGEHTQARVSEPWPSLPEPPSSPPSAMTRDVRSLTDPPGGSDVRPSLAICTDSFDHQTLSDPNPQDVQKSRAHKADAQPEPLAKPPTPQFSRTTNTATTSTSSDDPPAEAPSLCVNQRSATEASAARRPLLPGNEGQLSGRGKASRERSSTSDKLSDGRGKTTISIPPGCSSGDVTLQGRTADPTSYARNPQAGSVALTQMSREYSAQGRTQTTATGGVQDPLSLQQTTILESQGQPSFTAINSKRQPEVPRSTLSAGTDTAVITASALMHDKASRPVTADAVNAEARKSPTREGFQPKLRQDVLKTSHSDIQTPKQQLCSSSVPLQQRAFQGSQPKVTQSTMTSVDPERQSQSLPILRQKEQNSSITPVGNRNSARSNGQPQQTVTVDLTDTARAPERASNTRPMQASQGDLTALELGNLVWKARHVGQRRQRYADEVRSFDKKRQNAESTLDGLLEKMNVYMEKLSDHHGDLERLRNQIVEQEDKVESLRAQADRTRATAEKVTLECRARVESKRKAEEQFANDDKELKRLVQALGILG